MKKYQVAEMELEISANVSRYCRYIAAWMIDDKENEEKRNSLWARMSAEEKAFANLIVEVSFGEYL